MQKFGCSVQSVEVCSLARVLPCFINRQVMMALLSLGLPSHTLVRTHFSRLIPD